MNIKEEFMYDFDLKGPKVTITERCAIIENVKNIILISDTEVTCETEKFFLSVYGEKLTIGEIWEGRIELAGRIKGTELFNSSSKGED